MSMDDDILLPQVARELERGWGVSTARRGGLSDWEVVRAALEERIDYLLRHDPRKLTTSMYILDVREKDFAGAMEQPTVEDRAHALACVVMERETEKIRTRIKYGQQQQQQ